MSLAGTITGVPITRMAYERFDELITEKHHVVVRKWPLKPFRNPSNITSRIELELLYNVWNSGSAFFEKLTSEEMEVWREEQFASRVESMGPTAKPVFALSLQQTPAPEMTLFSELPQRDHSTLTTCHSPAPIQHVPLAPVTNLPPGPAPHTVEMMILADPTLQNVDPALIAMGITGSGDPPQARVGASSVGTPPDHVLPASGSKWRWQEVITPTSYDVRSAKKPRKQQKQRSRKQNHPQNSGPVV